MFILTVVLLVALANGQTVVRPGRYNPQIFGISGRYIPDHRGKYIHRPIPYNGGYGDRGLKYVHEEDYRARYWRQDGREGSWELPDSYEETAPYATSQYRPMESIPGYIPQEWNPGQHSYAEDYGYGTDGWRIIQFQWSKDGKTRYSYLYETESKVLAEEIGKLARLDKMLPPNGGDNFYQYRGDDGTVYEVDYVVNGNGLPPEEDYIHQSIQTVLKFLTKNMTTSS